MQTKHQYVSREALAEIFRVSVTVIDEMIQQGDLPAVVRVNGTAFFSEAELAAYLSPK